MTDHVCPVELRSRSYSPRSNSDTQGCGAGTHCPPICSGSWHLQVYSLRTGSGRGLWSSPTPAKPQRSQAQQAFLPCVWLDVANHNNTGWINTKHPFHYLILIADRCGSQGGQDGITFFLRKEVSRGKWLAQDHTASMVWRVSHLGFCFIGLRAFMAGPCIPSFVQSFREFFNHLVCGRHRGGFSEEMESISSRSLSVNARDELVNKGYPK